MLKTPILFFQVLQLFGESSLILDEVDLLLHPLKSELNWPLGQKDLLDFTRNKIGICVKFSWIRLIHTDRHTCTYIGERERERAFAGSGLRYEVPFHLMVFLFFSMHFDRFFASSNFVYANFIDLLLFLMRENMMKPQYFLHLIDNC